MTKVVLHYFNVRGLGEGPRMLLTYGGQEFEDHRFSVEEWPDIKPKTPFGQVPVLEWDGKSFAQCTAICRFLGRKYGLAGSSLEEDLEIDQNVDFYCELRSEAVALFYNPDEEYKAKKTQEVLTEDYPPQLKKLEEIVTRNNGHIALGKLTWGDFLIAGMHDSFKRVLQIPDLYEKYPNLKRIYDNVTAIPKVKSYIDSSPKSDY